MESELTGAPSFPASATPQDVETQRKLLAGRLEEFSAKLRTVNTKISQYQHDIQALQRQYTQMESRCPWPRNWWACARRSTNRARIPASPCSRRKTTWPRPCLHGAAQGLPGLQTPRPDPAFGGKGRLCRSWRNDIVNQLTTGNKDLQAWRRTCPRPSASRNSPS